MPATVVVQEGNGSPVAWTTITAFRLCTADLFSPGTNYPLPIPSTGFTYSFWKHLALYISGSFTQVSNIRFACDGAIGWHFGTGGALNVGKRDSGDDGCPSTDYQIANGVVGVGGYAIDDATNGHAYYNGQSTPIANVNGFTAGSPLTVDSGIYSSPGRTKAVVIQCKLATQGAGAQQGTQTAEVFSFYYSEI